MKGQEFLGVDCLFDNLSTGQETKAGGGRTLCPKRLDQFTETYYIKIGQDFLYMQYVPGKDKSSILDTHIMLVHAEFGMNRISSCHKKYMEKKKIGAIMLPDIRQIYYPSHIQYVHSIQSLYENGQDFLDI